MIVRSQRVRHAGSSTLPRNSIATTRTISASRITSSARKKPENSVAYHSGNAANIAPAAVISHTSLPSHTGPIVLISTRRRVSATWASRPRPRIGSNIPTPKSKPSSTK